MYAFMITLIYFGSAQENNIKNDNEEEKNHEPLQSHLLIYHQYH